MKNIQSYVQNVYRTAIIIIPSYLKPQVTCLSLFVKINFFTINILNKMFKCNLQQGLHE
jgi:hypothetical protein